ncbi:MAG: DMT family transporter [Phycisphaerae bacterium]|nr:DMT family transporter [Phycisphaerae bacterium]
MTTHKHRIDLIASLCCLGFIGCWTVGSLQIEYLTTKVDVWTQNFGRYSVACLFWMPFLFRQIHQKRLPVKLWAAAIPVACANMVMQVCWGGSFYHAEPGFITLLNKTAVIWVAGFSLIFFADERGLLKSVYFWIGLFCSITGVVGVIAFQEKLSLRTSFWGAFFPIASSIAWAVYTLLAKVMFKNTDSRINFSVITLYMVAGLGTLAFLFGKPAQLLDMNAKGWFNLITSGISAIALAHVFYYIAIQRIGATIPAMTLLSTPLFTIVTSRLIFHEMLTRSQLAFGAILITGAAAAILAQRDLQKNQNN